MSEIDSGYELARLRALPLDERTAPVEELIEKLEQELEQTSSENAQKELRPN